MYLIYVLVALGLASTVVADYHIDNANSTVSYSASSSNVWRTFSFATQNLTLEVIIGNVTQDITVDSSKCYDQNYALATCTTEDNCQITFPFTGSGVSIFIVNAGFEGVSANLAIDGKQSAATTLPAPAPPSYQTPNVSLFDFQSLSSGDHTATVTLLDWENGGTSLYFDYVLVNESFVVAPAQQSSSFLSQNPTSATSSASDSTLQSSTTRSAASSFRVTASASSTFAGSTLTPGATSAVPRTGSAENLGIVVGGACGGLVVLIVIIMTFIFLKKCWSRHAKLEESYRPNPYPHTSVRAHDQVASPPVYPQMTEKAQLRILSRDAAVDHSFVLSEDESAESHILSTTGSAKRSPDVVPVLSPAEPLSHGSFVIDCRREDRSSRGSVVETITPPTEGSGSAPPCYRTLDNPLSPS